MPWITTKTGKRINTDWFDEDAKKKERQIEQTKREGESKNKQTKSTVSAIDEKQRDPKNLIPKDSYTNDPKYKESQKWLNDNSEEIQNISKRWLDASKELDAARDKHLDPEMVEILGRREARMFVEDSDFPDTAEAREKERKLYARKEELDAGVEKHHEILRKFKKAHSEEQRNAYGRPEFKEASGEYPGFKSGETRTPYVDDLIQSGKAKIVEMTPEQYIHECAHYIFENSTMEGVLVGRLGDKDTDKYAKMMREGTKFDTPYINYGKIGEQAGNQEGLHRAVAAYINGIEKIPVVLIGTRR